MLNSSLSALKHSSVLCLSPGCRLAVWVQTMIRFLIIDEFASLTPLQQPDKSLISFQEGFQRWGPFFWSDSMWVNRNLGSLSLVKKQEWYWPQSPAILGPPTGSKGIQNSAGPALCPGQRKLASQGCWAPGPSLLSFVFPMWLQAPAWGPETLDP